MMSRSNYHIMGLYHYLVLLAVLLAVCHPGRIAQAQTYSVSGTIVDEQAQPLEGVDVVLAASSNNVGQLEQSEFVLGQQVATTDREGVFLIADLQPGEYSISAFFPGKQVRTNPFTLIDRDIKLTFTLEDLREELEEITIDAENRGLFGMKRLRAVEADAIYDAKKNEVIVVDEITANLATNNSRQIYAKVAGLNIWESDGAGVQLGIGGRGLSPNRNSNFNTRQNGYDIAADALGYPESYYSPPVQALQQIEIIRGAASLQYGTQFGGLLNFVFKEGPANKPIAFTSLQTLGSFGFFNSFNSLGGTVGKVNYYGFYQYKTSEGWRPNESLTHHTGYAGITYSISDRWSVKPEYTYMSYLAQQPGGLTDAQFEADPRQSNRSRNWFSVDWNLWAVTSNYKFSGRTNINTRFFGLFAGRDALGNLSRIDRLDFGEERDFISDRFNNWGNETRLIHRYPFLKSMSVFLIGTRYYDGFTDRKQGDGNAEDGPDFEYLSPDYLQGSDFDLPSKNVSIFAENILNLSPRLSLVPGVRFEYIKTEADGYYRNTVRDLAGNILLDERIDEQRDRKRSFVFFGLGMSYKTEWGFEAYANFSQNYRAINFNDIRVAIGSLEVDPDIADERGYNAELGVRGTQSNWFDYDVSLFHLAYKDRIGTILKKVPNPQFNNLVDRLIRFRTNIADANIYGIESYAEIDAYKLLVNSTSSNRVSFFVNSAFIDANYENSAANGVEGNRVELVPRVNLKTGMTIGTGSFEMTAQYSFVSEQFSDASNAIRTPTAIEGIIPSYRIMDISVKYLFKKYRLDAGVNNLTDARYFTRRATGYPGPGIIPSVGRSFYLTAGLQL